MKSSARPRSWLPPTSAFAGFRFPIEVIVLAVRWYLPFNLSYRNVEELLVERARRFVRRALSTLKVDAQRGGHGCGSGLPRRAE